jgi:predicted FMN-binding regulatory protein PaiB
MHTNPAFRAATTDQNLAFACARGSGILTLNGVDGPLASHIPYVLSPDGNFADLHLHPETIRNVLHTLRMVLQPLRHHVEEGVHRHMEHRSGRSGLKAARDG